MQLPRLFRDVPEDVQLSAHRGDGGYWCLRVAVRRGSEAWADADVRSYELLTTDELEECSAETLAVLLAPEP